MNDALAKSRKTSFSVIPADPGSGPGQAPESRNTKKFWTPAPVRLGGFAWVTALMTFCEAVNEWPTEKPQQNDYAGIHLGQYPASPTTPRARSRACVVH